MRDFNAECPERPGVTVGEDLADKAMTHAIEAHMWRSLVETLLPRLGTQGMTHNGHLATCPMSWPDWIESDPCTCGRDDLIKRTVEALRTATTEEVSREG